MSEIVSSLTSAFTLAFVVTSMFGLGLGLTIRDIVEPLRNVRLAAMAPLANFVVVPAVAYALTRILPLFLSFEQDLQIGLLLVGAVAGAPLAIKAAQVAGGDMRFAGSLIALQVVVTVVYLPLVLPLLIPGIQVDTVAVALPLILQILVPLGFGLLMNARYDEEADMTRPIMTEIANISLALMLVLNLANVGQVFGLLGTGTLTAVVLVIATGFAAGYLLGGPAASTRRVLGLATGHRNYAAALVIAGGSFAARPTVILMVLAASLINMGFTMLVAGELRRRAKARGEAAPDAAPDAAPVDGAGATPEPAPGEPVPAGRDGRTHA
jgi:BASS family bile acid:Na+ symporter